MPDRWFGYDAVDVLDAETGDKSFVASLLQDADRRKALAEWVRRGGKLIVSVGRNTRLAAELLAKMPLGEADLPLIPCGVKGKPVPCSAATNLARWLAPDGHAACPGESRVHSSPTGRGRHRSRQRIVQGRRRDGGLPVRGAGVLRPGPRGHRVRPGTARHSPLRLRRTAARRSQTKVRSRVRARARRGGSGRLRIGMQDAELLAEMQRSLENFEDVPVVSFGWVALFILLYIVIVGPLDYFMLKKVFKRLELTWITFPVVVLSVSVLAYLDGLLLKGDDLRINKIDLVEIRPARPAQAYGTTWFTLFSPRIQNYTIGMEPSAPDWAVAGRPEAVAPTHAVTVATHGQPGPRPADRLAEPFPPALRIRRGRVRPGARADSRLVDAHASRRPGARRSTPASRGRSERRPSTMARSS